ncbi:sensor histidine kinase [Halobacillus seohaensis]|uniref:sensor histidine kinase n=1 Tax=Halobacillus seohaensis TaxID=447421 RepID=UPI0036F1C676
MKVLQKFTNFYKNLTLRKRIVYLFTLAAFIPFFCAVILSYNAIYTILENKLEDGAFSHLKHTELSLSNTMNDLAQISHQFVYPSSLALKLKDLQETDDPAELTSLNEAIQTELDYISYTNSTAGLTMYVDNGGRPVFRNMPVRQDFSFDELPVIGKYSGITYYGPHISNNPLNTRYVVSISKEVNIPDNDSVQLYIESSFSLTQNMLKANQQVNNSFFLLLDGDGRIAYSELNSLFAVDDYFDEIVTGDISGSIGGYYWFRTESDQGWSMVSLISSGEYNEEKTIWITQMLILAVIFGMFSLAIAFLLRKMVYKPIRQFDSEIQAITTNNFQFKSEPTNIPEFDEFLDQLQHMKKRIAELIEEVELKEKKRADLEIEKLMYQINPHFLMNTLDTVHWLALINKQTDIDQLVSSLNKLLYYNLKKSGKVSTIEEEIDSLVQYCKIQEFRHNFSFNIVKKVEEESLKTPVPRFILQPLVENAIYHGLAEEGHIEVIVEKKDENTILISIHDNGSGLSGEEIENILSTDIKNNKEVIGIGMNYVKRMLESHYENRAYFTIKSEKGKGTTVELHLPIN